MSIRKNKPYRNQVEIQQIQQQNLQSFSVDVPTKCNLWKFFGCRNGLIYGTINIQNGRQKLTVPGGMNLQTGPGLFLEPEIAKIVDRSLMKKWAH